MLIGASVMRLADENYELDKSDFRSNYELITKLPENITLLYLIESRHALEFSPNNKWPNRFKLKNHLLAISRSSRFLLL